MSHTETTERTVYTDGIYSVKVAKRPKHAKFKFQKPVRLPFTLEIDDRVISHHRTLDGAQKSIAMHKRRAAVRALEDKQLAALEFGL